MRIRMNPAYGVMTTYFWVVMLSGGNPVENLSVSAERRMNIGKTDMPDQFERLMWEVTEQFGLPLAYMSDHHANLLQMVVPPRSNRG